MAYTTIDRPSDYFRSKLWTGDGSDNRAITFDESDNMQPDWVWYKARNHAYNHGLFDSVRGVDKFLSSNSSGAESTISGIAGFNSNGFTVGNDAGSNGSSKTFVGWSWKASGSTASNSNGSITSTVSANTTAGFSIVKYTAGSSGANSDTIGHGLSVIPQMIILKTTTATDSWVVYHHSNGAGKSMVLNNTTAVATNSNIFPTTPTSSTFYPGNTPTTNSSSRSYIAYCFAEKKGYSKFGSYTGNGNADGTFVYTGFKPAMVILKDYTSGSGYNWVILDNKRDPSNGLDRRLQPSSNNAEYTDVSNFCDFLSNGFKWTGSQANWNGSGVGYIFMAFAENPFVTSSGIPTTGR